MQWSVDLMVCHLYMYLFVCHIIIKVILCCFTSISVFFIYYFKKTMEINICYQRHLRYDAPITVYLYYILLNIYIITRCPQVSKETYFSVKRDLFQCQKRPIYFIT